MEQVKEPPQSTPHKTQPPKVASKNKSARPRCDVLPPFHVVLLDDNDHSHEYVMEMVRKIFGYDDTRGMRIANEVDISGRAVVFTTHRELAELKRDQIHSHGTDWRVATCRGSMSAMIQPADV